MKTLAGNIYKFLASIKLAVVLLVALAAILATATFYESLYDTKTAQHLVYNSPWFAGFLVVLFINVFCAAAIRYPWKSYQTGFVITHVGILVILTGSLQTLLYGVEGQMPIVEGESNDRVILDKPVLMFGNSTKTLKEIDAEFRWNPPRPDHIHAYPLGNGITAKLDNYYHHASIETQYVAAPNGEPAIHLNFISSRFDMNQWLTPSMGEIQMGLARVSVQNATQADIDELSKQGNKPVEPSRGDIGMLVGDRPIQVPVSRLMGLASTIPGTPYKARVLRYLPEGEVKDKQLVAATSGGPCVEVEFSGEKGSVTFALFAASPAKNQQLKQEGETLPIRALYTYNPDTPDASKTTKQLTLFLTPDSKLYYKLSDGRFGELVNDKPLVTGWMDIKIAAKEILLSAKGEEVFREYKMKKNQKEGPPPAIRVTLEGAEKPGPFWLQQGGERIQGRDAEGKPFVLGYSFRNQMVGVRIHLIRFEVAYDPGTRSPASFKSEVKVNGQQHLIQMNEPLHVNDFTFFQASYQENQRGPQTSILAVAYDPGIFLKYLGCIMLVGGIFTMFYLKPYMAGRKKHRKSLGLEEDPSDETE